jgi:Response regulator containing CheY-like receiver, AAA-type ATPase, and DNA-binding domains
MTSSTDGGVRVCGSLTVAMQDETTDVLAARSTASVLIVEPTLSDAIAAASTLTKHHFQVTLAESFVKAKERIGSRPPDVLITDIRLSEYNGLHLVLRATAQRERTAAIVLSTSMDEVLRTDAESMGATFMVKPVSERDLAAAVFRTLSRQTGVRRSTEPIRPPFERRSLDRRISVFPIPADRRARDRRRDLDSLLSLLEPIDPD